MSKKPAYEELENRVKYLEKQLELSKKTENQHRVAASRLETLLQTIPDITYFKDTNGRNILFNNKFEKLVGLGRDKITGKNDAQIFPQDVADQFQISDEEVLRTGKAKQFEETTTLSNSETIIFDTIKAPLFNDQDGIEGIIGISHDITKHKQIETDLQESEEKYRSIFKTVPISILIIDKEGTIVDINPYHLRHIGKETIRKADHIGKNLFNHPTVVNAGLSNVFKQVLKGKSINMTNVYFPTSASGADFYLNVRGEPILKDGKVIGAVIANEDLTDLKHAEDSKTQLEKQLQQAQKLEALGTMAGGIAHDFNNILSAIILNAEMAFDDAPKSSDMKKALKQILQGGQRAKNLVEHILTFSRDVDVEQKPLNIGIIVKETLKMLKAILPSTIITHHTIPDNLGTIMADVTQIQQLVMNLCTNAAHAMRKKGGQLDISLQDVNIDTYQADTNLIPGSYVKLIVKDTGYGIAPENKERIFDPFFTTKKPGEGTGLGLSVIHGIVTGHGGIITVDSQKNKGTTFEIFFPQKDKKVESVSQEYCELPTGREKILFVDDESAIVDVGEKILNRLGYQVVATTSGAKVLELFRMQPYDFDLVITDMTMPYMTGIDLSKELLNIRPDIPIIICSGYNYLITPEKAKAIGIRDYIMKPFQILDMAKIIRNVLDKELLERRQYKRFKALDNAVVIPESSPSTLCQIVDISEGGLSFCHNKSQNISDECFSLSINVFKEGFCLDKIPCKIVSDSKLEEVDFIGTDIIKRRCVQFGELPPRLADQLNFFLSKHTSAVIV